MKRNILVLLILTLTFSCKEKNQRIYLKEFKHYPNTLKTTKHKNNYYFLHNYYFIENAPKNNHKLKLLTDKFSDSLMNYKLNDSLKSVTLIFFTDKESIWTSKIDENYYGEGYRPEDYYNPRRAEYSYRLDKNNNTWLEKIIYENETKKVIPKISFIEKKKLEKKNE